MIGKNGIRIDNTANKKKEKRVKPLEYALDMMTFYRMVNGIRVDIVVPKFSHLRSELKKDGWRVDRANS